MGRIIASTDRTAWREELARVGAFDVYHLPEYHQIAANKEETYLYVFEQDQEVIILPFMRRATGNMPWTDNTFFDALSVYGYPGPLCNTSEPQYIAAFRSDLRETLSKLDIVTFFVRMHPLLSPRAMFGDEQHDFGPTVSLNLDQALEDQLTQCRKKHRYEFRKSLKLGVTPVHAPDFEDLDQFVEIYEQRMRSLQATDFYFFQPAYYDALKTTLREHTHLVHAVLDEQIIASALFFLCGRGVQYHLSGTREGFEHLSPTRVILEDMRRWATEQDYRWMHLGGGVGGDEDSLFRFKAGFGKDRCDYQVGKLVIDPARYEKLVADFTNYANSQGSKPALDTGFFPIYRTPLG